MTDITGQIKSLHAEYARLTGMSIELTMSRMFCWQAFLAKGFTAEDLALVVARLKAKIKAKQKWPSCLLFRNLIENLDFFDEDRAEARAMARNAKPHTDRDAVLASTGRTEAGTGTAKTAAQVLAEGEAFAQFKKWREVNGL